MIYRKKVDEAQLAADAANGDKIKKISEATFTAAKIAYNAYFNKKGGGDEKSKVNALTTDELCKVKKDEIRWHWR